MALWARVHALDRSSRRDFVLRQDRWIYALATLLIVGSVHAQQRITDSTGTRLRLLEGGRFIQGTSGGERVLQRAFPLSTTGQ